MIRFATRAAPAAAPDAPAEETIGLSPEARQFLLARAGGDAARLRMLMRTAMFLAETENAPEIDIDLARRAAALQPAHQPAALRAPAWATKRRLRLAGALAVWSALCLAGGMALERGMLAPGAGQEAAPGATAPGSAPAPAAANATGKVQPPGGAASAAAQPPASPAPVPAAAPRVSQAAPQPRPDAATPPQAPPATAVRPPASVPLVLLRFYLASPGAAPRARFIEQRLQAAGFIVRTVPDARLPPPRGAAVVFFHPQDAALARRAEAASALLTARPLLVRTSPARRPPQGMIEFLLP
jgi:hypothetical protein